MAGRSWSRRLGIIDNKRQRDFGTGRSGGIRPAGGRRDFAFDPQRVRGH